MHTTTTMAAMPTEDAAEMAPDIFPLAVPIMPDLASLAADDLARQKVERWAAVPRRVAGAGETVRGVRMPDASMEPLVPKGALLAVVLRQIDPEASDGAVVFAQWDKGHMIRRLELANTETGRVAALRAENREFGGDLVLRLSKARAAVIGVVVWMSVEF